MDPFSQIIPDNTGLITEYKGKKIYSFDEWEIKSGDYLNFSFESTNGKNIQGFVVMCPNGLMEINNEIYKKKTRLIFWEDTAPESFKIKFSSKESLVKIRIFNEWKKGDIVQPNIGNVAMIIEEIQNGRRYKCNDGEMDDDFDDLIFKVEKL